MDAKKAGSCSGDGISSLPDDMLTQILCLLPTKRAASTAILSKRWRNLFPKMIRHSLSQHHLQFDDSDLLYHPKEGRIERFRAFVDSTLSLQQQEEDDDDGGYRSPIKKLSLKVKDGFDHIENHASRWMSNALERGVLELDLRITMPSVPDPEEPKRLEPYHWPLHHTIFTSNNTLVKLTLGTRIYIGSDEDPIQEVFFPALKSLFLYTICFEDMDLNEFLYGCPVLEELYVHHTNIDPECWLTHSTIIHPTLKRLTLHRDFLCPYDRDVAFSTPSLAYLDFSDESCDYGGANFAASLLEARINLFCRQDCRCEP